MTPTDSFNSEQQEYLKGFFSGIQQRCPNPFVGQNANGQFTGSPEEAVAEESVYGTPVDDLSKEELVKYEQNGLDAWDKIIEHGEKNAFADGGDIFRFKFHGLFYVKPAQNSYMLRCRIPACAMRSHQLRGLAEIAEDWGGGYADVTTRGNLQVREIMPNNAPKVLMKLIDLGITAKGSGADNVRNITASPTTGFDPDEFIDVQPYAKLLHHTILQNRDLYGLPRKFNVSFDSGAAISVCADTNDIGFYAVRVEEGHGIEPGVYFRVQLCGITGHKQFAKDTGLLIKPEDSVALACAMIRVFIEHGDRTNRNRARLKYLVDDWGVEKFLDETEQKLTFELQRFPLENCIERKEISQHGYIGVHPQVDEGLRYIGIVTPVGRLSIEQMKTIASLSEKYGKSDIRLTVWQNVLLPHIKVEDVSTVREELLRVGLKTETDSLKAGLVACTGNRGCKFANANTKGHAVELGDFLSEELSLDQPINIHLTGCPHSCAQHYIGDIGLLGTKVKQGDESVEGYHVYFGGGVDNQQGIAREAFKAVPFDELKPLLRAVLTGYLEHREPSESFLSFTRRNDIETLTSFANEYTN